MKLPTFTSRLKWRLYAPAAAVILGTFFLLFYKLGSLSHGLGPHEARLYTYSQDFSNIMHNPLSAPINLLHWLAHVVDPSYGQTITRLPSVFFGILTLVAMYYIIRKWYGRKAALFGIILFACSGWFLHNSRLGTNDIMYLWALPWLLATFLAWDTYRQKPWVNYVAIASLLLVLYVPGMVWLVVVALALQPHHLTETWSKLTVWWQRLAIVGLVAIFAAPLALAFINNPNVGREWLALPQHFNNGRMVVHRMVQSVTFAVYRGPIAPEIWLERMPVLDIFTMAMAAAGTLFYLKHFTAARTRLLLGIVIVSALLFSLGGPVNYGILVSVWYLLAAGGIGYLLKEWLQVFPRNPIARNLGYSLISLAVAFSCIYNIRSYFVAWPHNVTTVATFKNKIHR